MSRSPSNRDGGGANSKDGDDYQCQDLSMSGGHHHQQPGPMFASPQQAPQQQVAVAANILALSKLIQSYRQRLQQQQPGGDPGAGGDVGNDLGAGLAAQNPQVVNLLLNMYNNQQQQQQRLLPGVDPQQFARFQQQLQQQAANLHNPQQLLGQFVRFGHPPGLLLGQNQNGNPLLAPRPNFPAVPSMGADGFRASMMMASPPPSAATPLSPPRMNSGRGHRGGRGHATPTGGSYQQQQQQHHLNNNHQNHRQQQQQQQHHQHQNQQHHEESFGTIDVSEENTEEFHQQDESSHQHGRKKQAPSKAHHPRVASNNHNQLDGSKLLNSSGASSLGAGASNPRMMFTLLDLDLVLYGIIKSQSHDGSSGDATPNPNQSNTTGHAISGLSLGHLAYGIDKILSSNDPSTAGSNTGGHNTSRSRANCPSTPDIMLLDLPEGFSINQSTLGGCVHYGVFSQRELVPCGTRFGPFQGRQVNPSEIKTNDDNTFMWEIFKDNKLSHFVDGRGSNGNWLAYVNCARFPAEQNLVAHQENGLIYYDACRDINAGAELLVWYGNGYAQAMGIPIGLKDEAAAMEVSAENEEDGSNNPEGFACERCGKVFAYKYYRDKHLKYTRCVDLGDRKFPCHLCNRSFEKRDRLRIHVLHVHEKHRPHKCSVCGKSFSQSSSLNKHMRVHSGERPYKCVYCSKAFTASSILRTHIRQHSGEKPFKCRHCGKSFASHAAHDSHVRRTHLRPANDNGMMMIGTETPTSVPQSPTSASPSPSPQPSASLVIFPG